MVWRMRMLLHSTNTSLAFTIITFTKNPPQGRPGQQAILLGKNFHHHYSPKF
jgi:hypothetical protein